MKKRFRVKKTQDIESIIQSRRVVRNRFFKVYKKENHDNPHFRFAVSVPKKYGKAHERNKMKRRVRMIISKLSVISSDDFFIIVNPEAISLPYDQIEQHLIELFVKQNLIEVKE